MLQEPRKDVSGRIVDNLIDVLKQEPEEALPGIKIYLP